LDDAWSSAHGCEFLLKSGDVFFREESGMDGRAELMIDAGGEHEVE